MAVIINKQELFPRKWKLQCDAGLAKWPEAKEALETLEQQGCKRSQLLQFMHEYVTSPQSLEPGRQSARRTSVKIKGYLLVLKKASEALSSLRINLPLATYAAIYQQKELEGLLVNFEESLVQIHSEYAKKGSAKGEGRDEELLVSLAMWIEGQTGAKHRRELSLLLQVAAEANGTRFPADESMLRKIIERYRRGYPTMHSSIAHFYCPKNYPPPKFSEIGLRP